MVNFCKGMQLVLLCSTLIALTATAKTPKTPKINEDDDYDEFIPYDGERFDGFDWRLCREVNANEPGNVVVSPVGLKLVLVMLFEGAVGSSAAELRTALQLPQNIFLTRDTFSNIMNSLQEKKPEYTLNIGTNMYIDKSMKPHEKIAKLLSYYYRANVKSIDFHKSASAMMEINSWVSNVTNGHIKQMITEESKVANALLMIMNAIYFKGTWRYPFRANETTQGLFHVTPTKTVTVNYMRQTEMLYYSESKELDAKLLRLPYLGKKYSMFIVLPNTVNGFHKMLNIVNPLLIREQLSLMAKEEVEVILPRFKFDYTTYLKEILKKVGIREVFSQNAKLSLTTGGEQLSVSNILQKVGLDVNEEGTTAWAATEMTLINKFGDNTVQTFNASHPFMIFIEEEKTGTVVFVGKVVDPTHAVSFKNNSFISRMSMMDDTDNEDEPNPYQPDEHKFILPASVWRYIISGAWLRGGQPTVYENKTAPERKSQVKTL